ncbi:MAG: transketolase [Chloroflexi bacterium]|nr:transketolase [Chloroflexota bacterium]
MSNISQSLDELCINTIRFLSADGVQKANSGHPGLPMGAAAMAYKLWMGFLRHNPRNPTWPNRDRFVLSAGHGSMLLYSLLHLTGYDLPLEELMQFRQWGSKTPGHPERHLTPGVETTTGPLGQGISNAIGMAIAEAHLAVYFNRPGYNIVDHYTYVIASDGDLMEGVASEAASLAGHLRLGKLIVLYDDNNISIEGTTQLAFTEDRVMRFEAYGWHTQVVPDGNNLDMVDAAIRSAQGESRPSFIACRTTIGYGAPHKQGTAEAHGEPLGPDELVNAKRNLGWPLDPPFFIPGEALENFRSAVEVGALYESQWQKQFGEYAREYPDLAAEFQRRMSGKLPEGWDADLPTFPPDPKGQATRASSGVVQNAIAKKVPELIGGSADLAPSTRTLIKDGGDLQAGNYGGRNMHFGVREHGMSAIVNGMALHGGVIPYGATFLIFSDYSRPAIRLASIMENRALFIFTHDSIGLGEDGPTHQPIEHLSALRAIPGLAVVRPADANEVIEAWRLALAREHAPTVFALTRQNVPTLDRANGKFAPASGARRGGYVLADTGKTPDVILMSSGSEVAIAVEAWERLKAKGITARVVSMPCMEVFAEQPQDYRDSVLPPKVQPRVAIEAGAPMSWYRWVGDGGAVIGLERFGASAPYKTIYEKLGLTAEALVKKAEEVIGGNKRK